MTLLCEQMRKKAAAEKEAAEKAALRRKVKEEADRRALAGNSTQRAANAQQRGQRGGAAGATKDSMARTEKTLMETRDKALERGLVPFGAHCPALVVLLTY